MSITATAPPKTETMPSPKQQFLDAYAQEHGKTMRVLRAYPKEKAELKPHPKSKTARDLAWMFALEKGASEKALTTGFDWSKAPSFPPAPESFDAILSAIDQGHEKIARMVEGLSDDELFITVQFPTAPKTISEMPRIQFLWMMLCDEIHHRGQFSVYLRMADAKVPSIYGPSLDEPWF
jgi:uncharacterized damage-inducible protein DinB